MPKITNDFTSSTSAFSGAIGEHSTRELSTEHEAPDSAHAQDRKDTESVDSNLEGTEKQEHTRGFELAPLVDWRAGEMTAWAENDDYREFFEKTIGPETALRRDSGPVRYNIDNDGDYDDDGGIPTAIGHSAGYIHPGDSGIDTALLIIRR